MHGLFFSLNRCLLSIKLTLAKETFQMVKFLFVQEINFSLEMVLKKRTGMKGYGFTVLAILINPFFPNAYFLYTLKA